MHHEPEPRSMFQEAKQAKNIAIQALEVWGASISILFRIRTGKNYLGMVGVTSLIFPFVFGLFAKNFIVLNIIPFTLFAVIINRIELMRAWYKGEVRHTYYSGYSWFGHLLFPRMSERLVKGLIEPFYVMMIGLILKSVSEVWTIYFVGGGFAMSLSVIISQQRDQQRLEQMQDAMLEGQYFAAQVRPRRRF